MLRNEEEVKAQVVLPYLKSLGVEVSEIRLERSFKVRIGRFTEEFVADYSRPRFDVLVTRGSNNLFIVEVKREGHAIDQDDVDQAVSYARLLDNIAPICIITNGIETLLIDSITGLEIPSEQLNEQFEFTPSVADDLREQALEALSRHVT